MLIQRESPGAKSSTAADRALNASKRATSRPRLRSEGMAPDGAALKMSAPHSPGVLSQIGTHPSPTRALGALRTSTHGPIRSDSRLSDGSPYGLRWRRGLCVPFGRICDSQQYWVVPASRPPPHLRRGSAPSVAHGHDIDNILSIGIPQAPSYEYVVVGVAFLDPRVDGARRRPAVWRRRLTLLRLTLWVVAREAAVAPLR
jgi:hypothetical protein